MPTSTIPQLAETTEPADEFVLPVDDGSQTFKLSFSTLKTFLATVFNPTTTRGDLIRRGASALERFAAVTDNRVVRGNGTDVVLGQIDDPGFFTSGAAAAAGTPGIVATGNILNEHINASAAIAGSKLQAATNTNAGTINYYLGTTFTPTVGASATNYSSITYSTQSGTFTRIGRMVFFTLRVAWSNATGSPTGTIIVGGLPHAANADHVFHVHTLSIDTPATPLGVTAYLASGSSTLSLVCPRDAATDASIDPALNSGATSRTIFITGAYSV
jgi:hypothetical protein